MTRRRFDVVTFAACRPRRTLVTEDLKEGLGVHTVSVLNTYELAGV